MHADKYAYPRCGLALEAASSSLACPTCGDVARPDGKVVDFSTKDLYWSYIARPAMSRMVETARREGLDAALDETFTHYENRDFYRRIMNESRGDFRFLLPVGRQSAVLDLGSGWGATTLALARQFAHVTACDGTKENLEFLACRARAAELNNMSFVRIDPLEGARLPFQDGSFAAVILNGVLEWIGTGSMEGSPEELQRQLLLEVRRVLQPGGCVYVAIENRFYALYWLGKIEPHTMLPFVSVLPRAVANRISLAVRGRPFRNYTPSYGSLNSLVRKAGFDRLEFYLPLPSYQHPEVILPIEGGNCLRYWVKHLLIPRRFLHRVYAAGLLLMDWLGILKFLASDFVLVARRQA
ncbi:MAG: class I SAM-dependent methyltransferase [Terriglobales bacterium]